MWQSRTDDRGEQIRRIFLAFNVNHRITSTLSVTEIDLKSWAIQQFLIYLQVMQYRESLPLSFEDRHRNSTMIRMKTNLTYYALAPATWNPTEGSTKMELTFYIQSSKPSFLVSWRDTNKNNRFPSPKRCIRYFYKSNNQFNGGSYSGIQSCIFWFPLCRVRLHKDVGLLRIAGRKGVRNMLCRWWALLVSHEQDTTSFLM